MSANDPVMNDLAREMAERGKAEQDAIDRERFGDEDLDKLKAGAPPPEPGVDL